MGVNKQIILGNVGQEPRISTFADGGTVANFSVAYTEKGYTTKDGRQIPDSTEWFNIVAKNSLANVVQQYVTKAIKSTLRARLRPANM
jgi:single-strand binding protein